MYSSYPTTAASLRKAPYSSPRRQSPAGEEIFRTQRVGESRIAISLTDLDVACGRSLLHVVDRVVDVFLCIFERHKAVAIRAESLAAAIAEDEVPAARKGA